MGKSIGLAAALTGALLLTSSLQIASAAEGTAPTNASTDEVSQCTSLDNEWKAAEAACSTNANLGRARALAREAENKCKSADSAQRKLGISKFQSALRLCRKPDAPH